MTYQQAELLFASGELDRSFEVCQTGIKADGADGRFFLLAARIASRKGQHRIAGEFAAHAVLRLPQYPLAYVYLAKCYADLGRVSEARVVAERALILEPTDAPTWDLLGFVFTRVDHYDRARDAFQKAVAIAPGQAQYWLNLGAALAVLGDIDGAARAYETCIECDPDFTPAYLSLVNLRKQTPERNYVAKLESLFNRLGKDGEEAAQIGHALVRSYEEIGQYELALAALGFAKRAMKDKVSFSTDQTRAIFAASAATSSGKSHAGGHPTTAPIFVVGLPRSGTTLVERIISAHPDVASAGELPTFPALIHKHANVTISYSSEAFQAAAKADLAVLGREYEDAARQRISSGAARFVDKLPLNFLYSGLINRALPNARILCLRRDPMDSIVGNYRQFLGGSAYAYSYDLEDTARYFVFFDRLVAHWRENLPADGFTEVGYEDLVSDPDTMSRKIVAFCGLPWNEACLQPHENDAPVATLSSAQVREPINTKSVGRWRRYGAGVEPARRILVEAGILR